MKSEDTERLREELLLEWFLTAKKKKTPKMLSFFEPQQQD